MNVGSLTCVRFSWLFAKLATRTKESNMNASFSGVSRGTDQGVETCVQVSRESYPSGTDGDGRSCSSLVKAQASARVDVPTAPLFFCSTDQGVQHVCTSFFFFNEKAWICARSTTDEDLASVIPDKKNEKEREKEKAKKSKIQSGTIVISCRPNFFELIKYVRWFL